MDDTPLVITVLTYRVGDLYMADVHLREVSEGSRTLLTPPKSMAPTREEAIGSVVEWLSEMVPVYAPNREWRLDVPIFSEN